MFGPYRHLTKIAGPSAPSAGGGAMTAVAATLRRMSEDQQVVFLHGIGVGPQSWAAQIAALPQGFVGFAPPIAGLGPDDETDFTLAGAAARIVDELDRRQVDHAHLCGLSLGAMVATQVALDHPDRVASLVLSGGQVRPPRALMVLQSAILRVLPARVVAPDGTDKRRVLAVLREVADIDFRPGLTTIDAPTLVLCGSKDVANLRAARALAAGIPDARLRVVAGGGHELNTQRPEDFNAELMAFLRSVADGSAEGSA